MVFISDTARKDTPLTRGARRQLGARGWGLWPT